MLRGDFGGVTTGKFCQMEDAIAVNISATDIIRCYTGTECEALSLFEESVRVYTL